MPLNDITLNNNFLKGTEHESYFSWPSLIPVSEDT